MEQPKKKYKVNLLSQNEHTTVLNATAKFLTYHCLHKELRPPSGLEPLHLQTLSTWPFYFDMHGAMGVSYL